MCRTGRGHLKRNLFNFPLVHVSLVVSVGSGGVSLVVSVGSGGLI